MLKEFLILLLQVLLILNITFAIIIVLFERKSPGVTWAWVMIVLFVPFFGLFMYFLFGLDGKKYGNFVKKYKHDKKVLDEYLNILDTNMPVNHQLVHFKDIKYLNYKCDNSSITNNNNVSIYHEGTPKFDALIQDINRATTFIHMQYYILKNDELGKKIISALTKKASQNIEVKLLIDGMGSRFMSKKIFKSLLKAGGKVEMFMPPHLVKINFRNHRKICVIDGTVGYIGGFNIGNEYLGKVKKFGYWRDCHLRIEGDATKDLEKRFIMDWNYSSSGSVIKLKSAYFPNINSNGSCCMQIVSSGPDTKWQSIHHAYIKMLSVATKYIYIQTPYFIPDESIFDLLRIAALSGLDVKIMIPAYPDHPFVYWAAISYLGDLIEAGVKCYKYEKGFVHSKLVIVDGNIASVGTANIDIRSLKLNFEINAFIYSKYEIDTLEKQFFIDIVDCSLMDHNWYKELSTISKVKEGLCRLISPLL